VESAGVPYWLLMLWLSASPSLLGDLVFLDATPPTGGTASEEVPYLSCPLGVGRAAGWGGRELLPSWDGATGGSTARDDCARACPRRRLGAAVGPAGAAGSLEGGGGAPCRVVNNIRGQHQVKVGELATFHLDFLGLFAVLSHLSPILHAERAASPTRWSGFGGLRLVLGSAALPCCGFWGSGDPAARQPLC